jgi:hypothetical protein
MRVPSAERVSKRSTVASAIPARNASLTCERRRAEPPSTADTSDGTCGWLSSTTICAPFATSNACTSRSPDSRRSTGPPARGTRARWLLPPSSIRKSTDAPSGEKRGA